MAIRGQLPAYYIDNAMINFQPVNSALDGYREGIGVAGKSIAQINAANAMARGDWNAAATETARSGDISGAMALRRHPGEMRAQEDAARAREVQRLAGQLQPIISMPDGPERRAAFEAWRDSNPRIRQSMLESGLDPNDYMGTPAAIHGEAMGPRNPLEDDRTRAQIEAQSAAASRDRAAASRSGIIETSPGATLYDTTRREPVYTAPAAARQPRELSPSDTRNLVKDGTVLTTSGRLGTSFRDAYAVPGTVRGGDVANWYAQNAPERMTTADSRQRAQWWQDYRRNSELIERHELFGAALTPTEQASWRAATIHPNMNAATIRVNLARQHDILSGAGRRYARSLVSSGYDGMAIAEAFGLPPAELGITGDSRRGGSGLTTPATTNQTTIPENDPLGIRPR